MMTISLNNAEMQRWAVDDDCVALAQREEMVPVEGEPGIIFPPTYADVKGGYNIDSLADGTCVATIDSVGSQANRTEPIFAVPPLDALVPQVTIALGNEQSISLLAAGHRLGDAIIRCTHTLAKPAQAAFASAMQGDASPMAKLAPTSLLFGVWDSRGSGCKLPRIYQSVIRAWDVSPLTRSAQYFPATNYAKLQVFSEEAQEQAEKDKQQKRPESQRGFVAVPAPELPGGIVAHGPIRRDTTINLIALRRLKAPDDSHTSRLRAYILGLALVAATAPQDGFLRQGCLLTTKPGLAPCWELVSRDGARHALALTAASTLAFAQAAAQAFGVGPNIEAAFDPKLAKEDLKEAAKKKGKAANAD